MRTENQSDCGELLGSSGSSPSVRCAGLLILLLAMGVAHLTAAAPAESERLSARTAATQKTLGAQQQQTAAQNTVSPQKTEGAKPTLMTEDLGTDHLGGRVYSTGTDDIIVKILSAKEIREQALKKNRHSTGEVGFNNAIWMSGGGHERLIGSSHDGGKIVNLGKIPPCELVFSIKTSQRHTFKTGEASANPDNLPHAILRSFKSGMLQVWFEDKFSPKESGKSDRDFNDTVLQLTGGVVDNGVVVELLRVIKEQTGEARTTAIAMLKKADPKAAANAGFR